MAGVAQLVEQLIRNQQVRGSSPRAGSKNVEGNRIVTPMPLFCFLLKNPANFGKFRPACRQNAYKNCPNSDHLPGTLVERFERHRYQSANQTCPISTECSYPKYKIDRIPFSNFYLKASAVTGVMSRPLFFALSIPRTPAPPSKENQANGLMGYKKHGSFLGLSKHGFRQRGRCVQVKNEFGAEYGMAVEFLPNLTGSALDG